MWRNGRRSRLKIYRGQPRGGSSPPIRIIILVKKPIFIRFSIDIGFSYAQNNLTIEAEMRFIMSEKDSEYLESGRKLRTVKLITGEYKTVDINSIVGFCHYELHKGFLTVNLFKEHKCDEKECFLLEKFNDYPYWQRKAIADKIKAINKEKRKRKKINEARHIEKKNAFLERLKNDAQKLADSWEFPVLITRVAETAKKEYTIFYVSNYDNNDWYEYRNIAFVLNWRYQSKFTLKHIKLTNGHYASISDWINRKK